MGKKMKKTKKCGVKKACIAVLLMLGMLLPVPAFAQDIIEFSGLNLSGDTVYLPSSGTFAVGVGSDIATVFDYVTIRAMAVTPMDDSGNRWGVGVGVNLPDLVKKHGGQWLADNMNMSTGISALANMNGKVHIEPAIYMTVFKW